MSEHTPGPWEMVQNIVVPTEAPSVNTVNEVAYINGNNPGAAANADIITAAPEMYEALEDIARVDHIDRAVLLAQEALAKARGE